MNTITKLLDRTAQIENSASEARANGDERAAGRLYREALDVAMQAVDRAAGTSSSNDRLVALQVAVRLSFSAGETGLGRRLLNDALARDQSLAATREWIQLTDASAWPEAWLIVAVRREEPDTAAMDALVDRHWRRLFGHCHLLTADRESAQDLAQQAWCRVLRGRRDLKPGGNFAAYLTTIATNLWRDSLRTARRAGPMADARLASLDAPVSTDSEKSILLGETVPDARTHRSDEQWGLKIDIDRALGQMAPHLRDVLIARFITGESCAALGLRYQRTEQTISGWVREAVREMKRLLEEPTRVANEAVDPESRG